MRAPRSRSNSVCWRTHCGIWGVCEPSRSCDRSQASNGATGIERASSFVADIGQCHVLAGPVGSLLLPLRALVSAMDARQRLPQIEMAIVRAGACVHTVLVFRVLDPLSA